MLNEIVQRPECAIVLNKLRTELPAYIQYHTIGHTMDVCSRAEELALQENIPTRDIELLLVAAAYHDTGYLVTEKNHEAISCTVAEEVLPRFGYTNEDLKKICSIIMATKIPHTPHNILEQIICDADLDYLGRDDFFAISKLLYHEMRHLNFVKNEEEWNNLQVIFLENHHYFTATAIKQRQALKEEHLSILKHKLVKL